MLPSKEYWDNSTTIFSDVQESRLSQIKVLKRRVAPATVVVRQSIIRRTEVGGCDSDDTAREAPFGVTLMVAS